MNQNVVTLVPLTLYLYLKVYGFSGNQEGIRGHGQNDRILPEETIIEALKHVVNADAHPLLVMCSTGRHRTGMYMCVCMLFSWVVACLSLELAGLEHDIYIYIYI